MSECAVKPCKMKFHSRCGDRVTLLKGNTAAVRNFVEFNHGLILSAYPLQDDIPFEVRIDRKVPDWNGSLEIGVTTLDPEVTDLPATATQLRNTAWILSGCSVVQDGMALVNTYGPEMHTLEEGDCVGVTRTNKGELRFSVNGRCLGVAAENMPQQLFGVIDLYGQCVQVTIMQPDTGTLSAAAMGGSADQIEVDPNNDEKITTSEREVTVAVASPEDSEVGATPEGSMVVTIPEDSVVVTIPETLSGDPEEFPSNTNNVYDPKEGPSYAYQLYDPREGPSHANEVFDPKEGPSHAYEFYDPEEGRSHAYEIPDPREGPSHAYDIFVPITTENACALVVKDRIRFHPRCGILVKLSANNKTAERARPMDDYNNGVVMTHRPLFDDELFEIRIDRLVEKWSGSIELGVTTHNPSTVRFPSTMTNMDSGTIMMSGCKVLVNGQGTCLEYGNYNLDELRENDTLGMMRNSDGQLHYFINGVDQGVAMEKVDPQVWGVIDLYGMTVKVSIIDPCEDLDRNAQLGPGLDLSADSPPGCFRQRIDRIDEESLLFHTLRDSNVIIINDGKTAHRPNAFEHFNNGIVMTNRTLKTNELFQVRLDLVIAKWAGSIEIGVTQLSCNEIEFPFKMSNAKSGTWAMTGEDVIQDGTIIIPQYVRNLNRLVEGDTVGVMRKDVGNMGFVHFFVNGVDQGPAAFNVPEHVFGIVDLYGRVAQATIVDYYLPPPSYSPESPLSTESNGTVYPEMCFHRVHGHNARLSRNRLTACRATVFSEFNDAVLFSSRPLRECEMFELRIDKMVDCWIGSLEIGVTAIKPEELDGRGGVGAVAGTATDLSWDTYILSGAAMMKDGECVRSGYPLDLDALSIGSRVGLMWHADRSLHYYLDGMDQGRAWYVPHLNIYAIVDLYGQCTQVTILPNEERQFNYNGLAYSDDSSLSCRQNLISLPPPYCFSEYCGSNVVLMYDYSFARRMTADPSASLVFSAGLLAVGEMFEIKITEAMPRFAGGFRMGVTDINVLNAHVNRNFPPSICFLPHYTAYIDGVHLRSTCAGGGVRARAFATPSFQWLHAGDRVGLRKTADGRVDIFFNSDLVDVAFENVPDKVYVVMELFGLAYKMQAISKLVHVATCLPQPAAIEENVVVTPTTSEAGVGTPPAGVDAGPEAGALPAIAHAVPNAGTPPADADAGPDAGTAEADAGPDADTPPAKADAGPDAGTPPAEVDAGPDASLADDCRRKHPLPYTFHDVHGANITLTSSDTVAVRKTGYKDGLAIVSQPLVRGQHFRFRVDKLAGEWSGGVAIGAVGSLPAETVPETAQLLQPPAWLASCDLIADNGCFTNSNLAACLEDLGERSVLCLHFRFNDDLVLEVDGRTLGAIAVIPPSFPHVYPFIDLYGKVYQVSVLLHPYVVAGGASMELPIITEHQAEETSDEEQDLPADPEPGPEPADDDGEDIYRLLFESTLVEVDEPEEHCEREEAEQPEEADAPVEAEALAEVEAPAEAQAPADAEEPEEAGETGRESPEEFENPGEPEQRIRRVAPPTDLPLAYPPVHITPPPHPEPKAKDIDNQKRCAAQRALHQSFLLADTNDEVNRSIQRSHSTHCFPYYYSADDAETMERFLRAFTLDPQEEGDEDFVAETFCDTNNDRPNRTFTLDRREEDDEVFDPEIFCDASVQQLETLHVTSFPVPREEDDADVVPERSCDTNIRHNDRYPEAGGDDDLGRDDASLPELTDEGTADESARRDDEADTLCDNLQYLHQLISLSQSAEEAECAWQASGEGCEHLHLVLKFWSYLVMPYPDLRLAVTNWGRVICYCVNCKPDADPQYSGWVCIERTAVKDPSRRNFWHVDRSTVAFAQAGLIEAGCAPRPPLVPAPLVNATPSDIWFDEEGKPHHTTLALEIETESSPDKDRLVSFLINLRPYSSAADADADPPAE